MRKPRVFVSSTCFDLRQVREDLRVFIEGLGYEAVLSEYPSFPVHPDRSTTENCKQAVRDNCDILILVVGGRYGSVDEDSGKSITNAEYLEALASGHPTYVFVQKAVETLFRTWQSDHEFKPPPEQVESPKIFDFIAQVRESSTWIYQFEIASDITSVLRVQWAYLFSQGLEIYKRIIADPSPVELGLSGDSLNIALRKETNWRYYLFVNLLDAELHRREGLKRDLNLRFSMEVLREFNDAKDVSTWLGEHIRHAPRIISSWNAVVDGLNDIFQEPDEAKYIADVSYVATRLGTVYEASLEWALKCWRVAVPSDCEKLRDLTSRLMDNMVASFPQQIDTFSTLLSQAESGTISGLQQIDWVVELPRDVQEELDAEIARLTKKYNA